MKRNAADGLFTKPSNSLLDLTSNVPEYSVLFYRAKEGLGDGLHHSKHKMSLFHHFALIIDRRLGVKGKMRQGDYVSYPSLY
jgi:hypothetical protein